MGLSQKLSNDRGMCQFIREITWKDLEFHFKVEFEVLFHVKIRLHVRLEKSQIGFGIASFFGHQ
ncbi:hypothetical protein B1748_13775 [Paenibacillus sp. MY03]|nr:hypothetical protein B1748_13775 [Paenibacillus sp. MY03]